MAGIEDKLRNVRTLEDIVSILSILFNNMNSLSRNYYDIFLNSTPMSIPMKLYDDNGDLVTVDVKNIASYKTSVILNPGNPDNVVSANKGAFCIDTSSSNQDLYYKTTDDGSSGWLKIYDDADDLLKRTGDGQFLTNLSTTQITNGILPIARGGTASAGGWSGLVYSDGTQYRKAVEGVDYMGSTSSVGIVSYFYGKNNLNGTPIDTQAIIDGDLVEINENYVVCNGAELPDIDKYSKLRTVLGGSTLPNLLDVYLKGSSNVGSVIVEGTVGSHTHGLSGNTGSESSHTHGPGTYDIRGVAGTSWMSNGKLQNPTYQMTGCFYKIPSGQTPKWDKNKSGTPTFNTDSSAKYYGVNDGSTSNNDPGMAFQAARNWSGSSASGSSHSHSLNGLTTNLNAENEKNDVRHMDAIPVMKF